MPDPVIAATVRLDAAYSLPALGIREESEREALEARLHEACKRRLEEAVREALPLAPAAALTIFGATCRLLRRSQLEEGALELVSTARPSRERLAAPRTSHEPYPGNREACRKSIARQIPRPRQEALDAGA